MEVEKRGTVVWGRVEYVDCRGLWGSVFTGLVCFPGVLGFGRLVGDFEKCSCFRGNQEWVLVSWDWRVWKGLVVGVFSYRGMFFLLCGGECGSLVF